MNALKGLTLPVKYQYGVITDANGKTIIKAERNRLETPLNPSGRDAILQLVCTLLNESFEYDKADKILAKAGY